MATGAFPAPLLPQPPISWPALNRASHHLAELLFWQGLHPLLNQVRTDAALSALPWYPTLGRAVQKGRPTLFAYSSLVAPKPADWPANAQITGFWFLDQPSSYTPSAALTAFLSAGDPPVYIGFGSMNTRDPRRTGELALRALALSGRRGILMRGWGGLDANHLLADVLMIDEVPHAWLFPQMAAVVHHGGAGTTGASLRAGVPAVLVPFFADQPFWAERVHMLGVGPAPIPRRRLTAERLAGAIEAATTPPKRARAAAVGRQIAAEAGVAQAITQVEATLAKAR